MKYNKLDRSKAPHINPISHLTLPSPTFYQLDNGIPVYEINGGTQDIIKLELIFNAGRPVEHKPMVARATAGLLKEGTKQRKAAAIAERIDYYGGSFSVPFNLDNATVALYSLTKHFDKLLPLVAEILTEATFPEEEITSFIVRNQQSLLVELSKTDVVAYRKITESIFTDQHPYGYNSTSESYGSILRDDLLIHYQKHYNASNCVIFISGKLDDHVRKLLNQHIGLGLSKGLVTPPYLPNVDTKPVSEFVHHPNAVQTAIRIGRRLFNRQHPDYSAVYVLNTMLGGYFGSRLMSNIREEQGYTYNIYSSIDAMLHDGYFYIGTEVGNEFLTQTLDEIRKELLSLQQQPADQEEMEMVKTIF
ncbi:MAG: insulinase family protein [Saprospiraceae bacterium]|nr:insulinase family protein [Saprospiraceae bacterium]